MNICTHLCNLLQHAEQSKCPSNVLMRRPRAPGSSNSKFNTSVFCVANQDAGGKVEPLRLGAKY